jgi:hypothetical protein
MQRVPFATNVQQARSEPLKIPITGLQNYNPENIDNRVG